MPEVQYDSGTHVRRVSKSGAFTWKHKPIFISEAFNGQALGLVPTHERYFEVLYGPLQIGWFDIFKALFHRQEPKPLR